MIVLNSIGDEIVANAGFDLSGFVLALNLRPERGAVKSVTPVLGVVNRLAEDGVATLLANQYVTYLVDADILTKIGRWQRQITYGSRKLPWVNFNVT